MHSNNCSSETAKVTAKIVTSVYHCVRVLWKEEWHFNKKLYINLRSSWKVRAGYWWALMFNIRLSLDRMFCQWVHVDLKRQCKLHTSSGMSYRSVIRSTYLTFWSQPHINIVGSGSSSKIVSHINLLLASFEPIRCLLEWPALFIHPPNMSFLYVLLFKCQYNKSRAYFGITARPIFHAKGRSTFELLM